MQSETFEINNSFKQGEVMSPTLFITVGMILLSEHTQKLQEVHMGYYKLKLMEISECDLGDDIMCIYIMYIYIMIYMCLKWK